MMPPGAPGAVPAQQLTGNFRHWTSASGVKAIAEFVSMDMTAETVQLKDASGQVHTLKWSDLSAEDIEYLLTTLEKPEDE